MCVCGGGGAIRLFLQNRKATRYMYAYIYMYTHGNKLGNTFSSWEKFEKINFPFSADPEITCISYRGQATGQFMEIHNILYLCYGVQDMPYMKNTTFTEYEFAFLLLHSAKPKF